MTFPTTGVFHASRGLILHAQNRFEEALEAYDLAWNFNPQLKLHSLYAETLCFSGRFVEALPYLDIAVKDLPDSAFNHAYRGDALYRIGRYKEAVEEFNLAVNLAPESKSFRKFKERALQKLVQSRDDRWDLKRITPTLLKYWAKEFPAYKDLDNLTDEDLSKLIAFSIHACEVLFDDDVGCDIKQINVPTDLKSPISRIGAALIIYHHFYPYRCVDLPPIMPIDESNPWRYAGTNNRWKAIENFAPIALEYSRHEQSEQQDILNWSSRESFSQDAAEKAVAAVHGLSHEELRQAIKNFQRAKTITAPVSPEQSDLAPHDFAAAAHEATTARLQWKKDRQPGESIIAFVRRAYANDLKDGTLNKSILRQDEELYKSLRAFWDQYELPKDLANILNDILCPQWKEDRIAEENLPEFIRRVYSAEIANGTLTKAMLRSNGNLYQDFYDWRRRKGLPDDLANIPTKSERIDKLLIERGTPPEDDRSLVAAARYRGLIPSRRRTLDAPHS